MGIRVVAVTDGLAFRAVGFRRIPSAGFRVLQAPKGICSTADGSVRQPNRKGSLLLEAAHGL